MKKKLESLDDVLADQGITDASEFLSKYDLNAPVARLHSPLVQMRGSVQLMFDRTITREEVNFRLAALRRV